MSAYLAAADALANLPGVDQLLAELLMAVMFQVRPYQFADPPNVGAPQQVLSAHALELGGQ